jgi:hypothetical protein
MIKKLEQKIAIGFQNSKPPITAIVVRCKSAQKAVIFPQTCQTRRIG